MTKVLRKNSFERKRKELVQKLDEKGGIFAFKTPIEIHISDFQARLRGELVEVPVHIDSMLLVDGKSLKFHCCEDLKYGICLADFFDGNDFEKIANAMTDENNAISL